ncbi:S8 family serine peptidase [Chloroflexota bacterium]
MKRKTIGLVGVILLLALFAANITPPFEVEATAPVDTTSSESSTLWVKNETPGSADTPTSVFWDTYPENPTISMVSGGDGEITSVYPGSEDYVNVIVQLKGLPVSSRLNRDFEALPLTTNEAEVSITSYATELRNNQQTMMTEVAEHKIDFGKKQEYTYVFNGIAGSVKMKDVSKLADLPQVEAVYLDYEVQIALNQSVPLIGAPDVWALDDPQVKGQGIEVAIIDTGIDYMHPDLGGGFGPGFKVIGGYDFFNNDADPMDDHGHGTHVAGIVAADGVVTGVAPEAKLWAYKVLDEHGSGSWSTVIAAIERAADPDGDPQTDDAVDVINMSLGGPGNPNDPVSQAVNAANDQGIIVVVAAGNDGPYYQSLDSPGMADKAITVGATDKSDVIASFSSRGPVPGSWAIKPDIVAPGVSIYSTVATTGTYGNPTGYREWGGTSMASPHIAGAAALLKQLYPTWAPEDIKANLMNTALDLEYDVYTEGAGRVQLYEAATAQALLTPASLSLGADDASQPLWEVTRILTLSNKSDATLTYNLSIADGLLPGINASVDPAQVTLEPGEEQEIAFNLSVENAAVPTPSDPPHSYEGAILAECDSSSEVLRVPFAFIKSVMLNLTFDEEPWTVLVHDRVDELWSYDFPGTLLPVPLPGGTYDVIVTYPDVATRVFKEGVVVNTTTNLEVSRADAIYDIDIAPLDHEGSDLYVNTGSERVLHKDSGIWQLFWGSFPTQKHFSSITSEYSWEWTVTTGTTNTEPVYDVNGYANDGISSNLTCQNDPADYKQMTWEYNPPPSADQLLIMHWTSEGPSGGWSFAVTNSSQTPLTTPFTSEEYYMPIPYSDFCFGYFYEEVYSVSELPYEPSSDDLLYITPYLVASDSSTIEGYLLGETETPVFSTTASRMPLGLSPPHWFGQFENQDSEIVLKSAQGIIVLLFMNQLYDMMPHPDLPYELYQDDTLIESGTLSGAGQPQSGPSSLNIPVSPGTYTMVVPYEQYYLGDQQGSALLSATFNTQSTDKNPPFLTSLNILTDGEVSDIITSPDTNEIRFVVADDTGLSQVALYYKTSGDWITLPLTNNGDEYIAQVTSIQESGSVSLKIVAEDSAGNSLTYQIEPAFTAQKIMSHSLNVGWNMFSLPLTPDPADWETQLGDEISPLYLHKYDPLIGGYQMWSAEKPAFSPEIGQGYWVKIPATTDVSITGGPAPTVSYESGECFAIHLLPGWNMIGHPFNFAVGWDEVTVYNPVTEEIVPIYADGPDNDAHELGWVLKYLYGYNTETGSYETATAPEGQLAPWHGYWVRANVECDLLIPLP